MQEWLNIVAERLYGKDGLEASCGHFTIEAIDKISDERRRGNCRLMLSTLELNRRLYFELQKYVN